MKRRREALKPAPLRLKNTKKVRFFFDDGRIEFSGSDSEIHSPRSPQLCPMPTKRTASIIKSKKNLFEVMEEKKGIFQEEKKNEEIFMVLQESLVDIFSIRKDKIDQNSYFSNLLVMMGDFHYTKMITYNDRNNTTPMKAVASILPQLRSGEIDMFSMQAASLMEGRRSRKFFNVPQRTFTKSTIVMDLYRAALAIYPSQEISQKIKDLSSDFFKASKSRDRFSPDPVESELELVEIPKILAEYIHSMILIYQGKLKDQLFEDLLDLILYIAVNIEKDKILDNSDLILAYSHLNELELSIRNIYAQQQQSTDSQYSP
jgi:hypothetical protein